MSSRSVFTPAEQNRRNILSVHLTLYNKRNEHDWFCSGLLSAASTMNISVSEKIKQTGRSLAGRLLTWDLARCPCDWGSQTSMPCSCKRTTTLWWNHGLWRRLYLIVMFGWDAYILDIRIDIVRSKFSSPKRITNIAFSLRLWLLVNSA